MADQQWNFLNSLTSFGAQSPMMLDANGQPLVAVPESKKEERELAKKLSPTGKIDPSANPKAIAQGMQPVPESMINQDIYKFDKTKIIDLLNQERSGIDQQGQALQNMRELPQEVNWKPLASFVGTMVKGGDNLAEAFPDVDTPEKRAMKVQQLENLLQNQRGDLTKNALGLLRQTFDDKQASRQNRFEQSQEKRLFDQARKEQAALVKEASDFKGSYRNVESALVPDKQGTVSVGRIYQSLSQFARLMGEKGVLTDTDTGRQLSPTLDLYVSKMESLFTSNPNARVDAASVKAMVDALATAKKAFAENYKMKADIQTEGYFQNPDSPYAGKKWSEKLIKDTYKPLEGIETPEQNQTFPGVDQSAIDAEIARRKAGK